MENQQKNNEWRPYVTIALIVINVLVFAILELIGNTQNAEFMITYGAMYPEKIQQEGEYWRFLTAVFMHFGPTHLLNNMVLLGAAGNILEKAIGRMKFLVLYLLAGIGGSVLSYLQMIASKDYAVSAGASGAIFGLIGGLLWIVIKHHGRYESLTGRGMIFMIVLALYYGISSGGIDNWGHVGGLIMGFLIAVLFTIGNNREHGNASQP